MTLTHGELFAGISGFGLGFEQNGIKTRWQVEKDKSCKSILKKHYPTTQQFDDVIHCGSNNLSAVDVISFGSPCQNLSKGAEIYGKAGLSGEQSRLFFEGIRIIRELQPSVAIWENVYGAISSHDGRDFAAVISAFLQCGACDIAWRTFNARHFGVPQQRRRIFVVADFRGERAGKILFDTKSQGGITPSSDQSRPQNAPDFEKSPYLIFGDGGLKSPTQVARTLTAHAGRYDLDSDTFIVDKRTTRARFLTPLERERLQGFPDNWTLHPSVAEGARIKMLGNAVCVKVSAFLGQQITRWLNP